MSRSVTFYHKGNFRNIDRFLRKMANGDMYQSLGQLAQKGVQALSQATPKDSGVTADSWGFVVEYSRSGVEIQWTNSNVNNGFNIAVGLQYGHGTGTGGYVSGFDYINPAIRPIFDDIANQVWKVVTSA